MVGFRKYLLDEIEFVVARIDKDWPLSQIPSYFIEHFAPLNATRGAKVWTEDTFGTSQVKYIKSKYWNKPDFW